MRTLLRRTALVLGSIIGLVAALALVLHLIGSNRLARAPGVAVANVALPRDDGAVERGRHLATAVSLCAGCHGQDLGGAVMIDAFPIGRVTAPNLTAGTGGFAATATTEDWVRALRHGVGRDGRTLLFMPSDNLAHMSDADLGAVLAYLATVPPVDAVLPERRIAFPGTIIFGVLGYGELPVNRIARGITPTAVEPSVSRDYGSYLIAIAHCRDCHGADLEGLEAGQGPPPGPDLTRSGALGGWSQSDFVMTLRSGIRPDGLALSTEMPYAFYAGMTDDELAAIWQALLALP